MLRKIIDSNQLRDENLRTYLQASSQNFAVLPDYVAMEAYKGNALVTITESMEILSQYPRQVIILKGTREVSLLSGRAAGLQKRMIDGRQTCGFEAYTRLLSTAKQGDLNVQGQILDHGKAAAEHMERMLKTAAEITEVIGPLVQEYSREHRAEIRTWRITSQEVVSKIVNAVIMISAEVFRMLPHRPKLPSMKELPNTFVFRAVLCTYLMVIERGSTGGGASVKKVRNDVVDMYVSAYSTFFDGVLSKDAKLIRIQYHAQMILKEIFLR